MCAYRCFRENLFQTGHIRRAKAELIINFCHRLVLCIDQTVDKSVPLLVQHRLYTLIQMQIVCIELAHAWYLLVNEAELLDGQNDGQIIVRAMMLLREPLS